MVISTLTPVSTSSTYNLPRGFKYIPYIPKKRISVKQTSKGSFSQKADPLYLHGTSYIDWTVDIVTKTVASEITTLYNLNSNYVFTGIWGENYLVEFSEWNPEPISGYFKATGRFRIICVNDDFSPSC